MVVVNNAEKSAFPVKGFDVVEKKTDVCAEAVDEAVAIVCAKCKTCGRSFVEDRLAKHEAVCESKTRKVNVFVARKYYKVGDTEVRGKVNVMKAT